MLPGHVLAGSGPDGSWRDLTAPPPEGGAWAGARHGEGKLLGTQPGRLRAHNSRPPRETDGRAGTWLGGAEGRYAL